MPNRKLLETARLLNTAQLKRLRLFLQSPYHNNAYNARQIVELYELVADCNADENHPGLDKALLSKRFFPEKPFREKEKNPIDSLSSDLFRLVRRFLMFEDAEPELDEDREHLAMARFFRKNNLDERFWQTIQALRKNLDSAKVRDDKHFYKRFLMEEEIAYFQTIFNTYSDDVNLLNAHRDLDTFFSMLKLEFACGLDFQRQLGKIDIGSSPSLTQALLGTFNENTHLHTPLNILYVNVMHLLEDPDDDRAFDALEKRLAENEADIPPVKYRNLQAYYRYFMGRRYVKQGGPDVLSRFFDLNERHLRAGYIYVDGKLLSGSLKLLVNIALKCGKTEWAEQLLLEHGPERIGGTRYPAESHSLCMAEVLFYKKDYAAASENLIYRLFENVNYSILADVLLVKIYYETQDDLIESRMKALEQKVRRATLSADSKIPYLNFIKKLDKIIRYAWQKNNAKNNQLTQEIQLMPAILEREWLVKILAA